MKKYIHIFAFTMLIGSLSCVKNDDESPLPVPELEINTMLNPSGVNPLCAQLNVVSNVAGKVSIEVAGQDGEASVIRHTFNDIVKEHSVPILGLYPDYENVVQVIYLNNDNEELTREEVKIITSDIPNVYTNISIDLRKPDKMEAGLTLISYRGVSTPNIPFMIDAFGKTRWILDYRNHPELNQLYYDVGIERLQNGNFYFGDAFNDAIYEVSVCGEVLNTWSVAPYDFHHNVQEKPNGNFLLTATNPGSVHLNGNLTEKDHVIEIDRQSGDVVNVWDLRVSLDEYRTTWTNALSNYVIDWAHGNAVIYDESDDNIIVSCQRQGLVKLDKNNKVVWILAPHLGWGMNRAGDDLNGYLLTPLDVASNPITDDNVLNGYENHPDFEWNWYQHAPMLMPNGHIMLFDNGGNRNYEGVATYSRAVEYAIDDTEKTVRQVWQYGKELGLAGYSSLVSDVDYLPDTGNVLFSAGSKVDNGNGTKGGKIIEVNYTTKEAVFEARLTGNSTFQFHRTERLNMYE